MWLCQCDCGGQITCHTGHLRSGNTKSCGCNSPFTWKHGKTNTAIERKYFAIKTRCYNEKAQNYSYYGGRGIKMCQEWRDNSASFYKWAADNGYQEGLEIDRIDPDGDYSPENCRFATRAQQMQNTRRSRKNGSK